MISYRVFDSGNAFVEVTRQALDDASSDDGPLPTHLANAAGAARRRDLVGRLRATLGAADRPSKLAAASALLALGDTDAAGLLRERAKADADAIVAQVFRGTALRLEGVPSVRAAFVSGDQDPQLANAIASVYNGDFDLVGDDVILLLDMIEAYVADAKPWIASMARDEWSSDLYIFATAIARGATLIADRTRARTVLSQLIASPADRDTRLKAKRLLASIVDGLVR